MCFDQIEKLRRQLGKAVHASLSQVCGGGVRNVASERDSATQTNRARSFHELEQWTTYLKDLAYSSISFPNRSFKSVDGKPQDVEILSDMGLARSVSSPIALAQLVCEVLEDECRRDGLSHDVRANASGIICIVTTQRAEILRASGRLPCPLCVKWLKGGKGLWWHQQREHRSEHSIATTIAASERTVLALVPYDGNGPKQCESRTPASHVISRSSLSDSSGNDHVIDYARNGDLAGLVDAVRNGYDPKKELDRNGASALLWGAGSGHLTIVKYLIEHCGCSAEQGQCGKRSFSGRTPLHWAARNGHLSVVKYLVNTCKVDLDSSTADGTTAFCWACLQGHQQVMEFLHKSGSNTDRSNSFGCNAVLWCAQGGGSIEAMKWLSSINCNMTLVNSNGHGALHKAAQRGHHDICRWLVSSVFLDGKISTAGRNSKLALVGPDSDGCCPSDLAGMEGHSELAEWLASQEVRLARTWLSSSTVDETLPKFLVSGSGMSNSQIVRSDQNLNLWEPGGGVRRMRAVLERLNN